MSAQINLTNAGTSMYDALLKIKHSLSNSINTQDEANSAIGQLCYGSLLSEEEIAEFEEKEFNVTALEADMRSKCTLEKVRGTRYLRMVVESYHSGELPTEMIKELNLNTDIINTTLEDGSSVVSHIKSMSASEELNQVICEVNDRFLVSNGIDVSDVVSQVKNNYPEYKSNVRTFLSNLVSCADSSNKINRESFIELVRQLYSGAHQQAEDETFELDGSNPLAQLDFLSTMINGIISALTTVFSAILQMIGGIFRILSFIFAGLSKIFSFLPDDTILEIKPRSSNFWVDGPLDTTTLKTGPSKSIIPYADKLIRMHRQPGLSTLLWNGSDGNTMLFNSYLEPIYDLDKVLRLIANNISNVDYSETGRVKYHIPDTSHIYSGSVVDCLLTDEQLEIIKYDSKEARKAIVAAGLLAIWNRIVSDESTIIDSTVYATYLPSYPGWILEDWPVDSLSTNAKVRLRNGIRMFSTVVFYVATQTTESWVVPFIDWAVTGMNPNNSAIQGPASAIYTATDYSVDSFTTFYHYNRNPDGLIATCTKSNSYYLLRQISSSRYTFEDTDEAYILNAFPDDRMFKLPSLNIGQLAVFFSIVAITVVASLVAFKVGQKWWRNRSRNKQIERINKLSELKTAAYGDAQHPAPSDPAVQKQAIKDYNKAVNKYNLVGGMFGWGSYDAVNNWHNDPDTGSASALVNLQDSAETLSSIGNDQLLEIINQIKTLIEGVPPEDQTPASTPAR